MDALHYKKNPFHTDIAYSDFGLIPGPLLIDAEAHGYYMTRVEHATGGALLCSGIRLIWCQ